MSLEEKKDILKSLLNEIIKEILSILRTTSPNLNMFLEDKEIEYSPLIDISIFFDFFYSSLLRNNIKRDLTCYNLIFESLINKFINIKVDDIKNIKFNPSSIENFDKFFLLTNLYFKIYQITYGYLDHYSINKDKKQKLYIIKGDITVFNCINFPDKGFYLPLISKRGFTDIQIPITMQNILHQMVREKNVPELILFSLKYTDQTIIEYTKDFKLFINEKSIEPQYQVWIDIINLFYNLSGLYYLFAKDTNEFKIIILRESDLFDAFQHYTSIEDLNVDKFLESLEQIYSELRSNSFIPFCPFFPYIDSNKNRKWLILPHLFFKTAPNLMESLLEIIYEKSYSKGSLLELVTNSLFKKYNLNVWKQNNIEEFNTHLKNESNKKKLDIDLIIQNENFTLLIQCKSVAQRKRNSLSKRYNEGYTQIKSAIDVIRKNSQVIKSKYNIDCEKMYGLVLLNKCFPFPSTITDSCIGFSNYTLLENLLLKTNGNISDLKNNLKLSIEQLSKDWKSIDPSQLIVNIGQNKIQIIDV